MIHFKCTQIKSCAGVVPQCPSIMCFTSTSFSGRFGSGLS